VGQVKWYSEKASSSFSSSHIGSMKTGGIDLICHKGSESKGKVIFDPRNGIAGGTGRTRED